MYKYLDVLWGQTRQKFIEYTNYRQTEWGATEVFPGVFIGNLASAFDIEALEQHHIQGIVCTVNGITHTHSLPILSIPLSDHQDEEFKHYFDSIVDFSNQHTNVLYHCSYGVSRSTTAALTVILTRNKDLALPDALEQIRKKRPSANPNIGFINQLIDWTTDPR
jgi:protein-tyrosine phosphatase|tara:strand:- start:66 stop:557 length:492 start_codon:yes stop_codon:yes gene_type:complete